MCWSREVSGVFAMLEMCSMLFMWTRNKGLDRLVLPMLFTIFAVEALEVLQWHYVEPLATLHAGGSTCHKVRRCSIPGRGYRP